MHLAHILRHIDLLGLEHRGFDAWLTEELDQRLVLRQSLEDTEEEEEAFVHFFLVLARYLLLCLYEQLRD